MSPAGRAGPPGAALAILVLLAGAPARGADLPEWAAEAVARPVPAWAARSPSVRLLDEERITVPGAGRIQSTVRGVVRVQSISGGRRAVCTARWRRGASEVVGFRAWYVDPHGKVTRLGRDQATESSLAGDFELYTDDRSLELAAPDPRPGSVFAWECVTSEDPLIAEWSWYFESTEEPFLLSRISLTLPDGLEPAAVRFGPDSVESSRRERTWTWERRDVPPATVAEPLASHSFANGSAVFLTVRAATSASPAGASFADWPAVSRWVDALAAPQAQADERILARVAELTAGVTDTLARIRALARSVQGLRYVAISLDTGHGGGYRPHAAADVLRAGYGDCKDKANLLCTMLRAAGQPAWLLLVSATDRDYVDGRWPSPAQFGHCILAVRAPAGAPLSATFDHPRLGRLLAFDPTDSYTVFGDLPRAEQGSLGLLVGPRDGDLVRLPVVAPALDRFERRIDAVLDADGNLSARIAERSTGQQAVAERVARRAASLSEYRAALERGLAAGGTSVSLGEFHTEEDSLDGAYRLAAGYVARGFARSMGEQLIFRAGLVTPRATLDLPDSARKLPIQLECHAVAETVLVKLPGGYAADEIPEARHLERDFARLDAEWSVAGDTLRFVRRWTVQPITLPAARYHEVREMLAANLAASQAVVVLVRR